VKSDGVSRSLPPPPSATHNASKEAHLWAYTLLSYSTSEISILIVHIAASVFRFN